MQSIDRKKGNEKSVLEEINDVTMFNRKYQPVLNPLQFWKTDGSHMSLTDYTVAV
jgi:hypothetical protein